MSLKNFIQQKCSGLGIITTLATYVGLLVGLDYLYTKYLDGPMVSAVVWSASVAFAIYAFVGLLIYCFFAQMGLQEEVDRLSAVKARLESQILKKRESSRAHPSAN